MVAPFSAGVDPLAVCVGSPLLGPATAVWWVPWGWFPLPLARPPVGASVAPAPALAFAFAFFFFFAFPTFAAAFSASFAAFAAAAAAVALDRTRPTSCRIRSKTSVGFSFESLGIIRIVNACNISKAGASWVRATSSTSHLTTSLRLIFRISVSVLIRARMRTPNCTPQPNPLERSGRLVKSELNRFQNDRYVLYLVKNTTKSEESTSWNLRRGSRNDRGAGSFRM
jgi:hypothetical protein